MCFFAKFFLAKNMSSLKTMFFYKGLRKPSLFKKKKTIELATRQKLNSLVQRSCLAAALPKYQR